MIPTWEPFWNKRRVLGLIYLTGGLLLLWIGLSLTAGISSGLRFSTLGTFRFTARVPILVVSGTAILSGVLGLVLARRPSSLHTWFFWINALGALVLVLTWAGLGRRIDVIGLTTQSLRLSTPIALGALGGILCERSGVVNIAIEGMMLTGACLGFLTALYTQSVWLGVLAALLGGAAMAAGHAWLSVGLLVDQIISGTVINILAVGVTGFIRRAFLAHDTLEAPGLLPVWRLPWLSDLPVAGQIFFRHQPLVYTILILVPAIHILLFHTRWGLRTRITGEHPRAADTLGVNVFRIRYVNVILGGALAGLAGAWFSLETVGRFDEIMTGGKGFIALAAMIFGKWNTFGALGAALLFGSADALQIKLQVSGVNVPYQILGMAPYVLTMIVLAGIVGRAVAPAAVGRPYKRGE